ncbi:hypothetical protein [Solitalea canadensis]|uniref:Uncharacterized protein n=1 Tax=Solitalea canadensis (strain ATCC 29591 / DSM 3403 / JCM 21819 / LMG 8368 / NBRC 15130 / NCIMB 12057 / USAM 9D) TaxID=929556 RepID=H8KTQ5_SOLCM|nr:hypothetical protein [Solitalea canadensis]AFD06630.1 hypothetical protein Solca_1557 [Solitalea canadensis DSM 3403]
MNKLFKVRFPTGYQIKNIFDDNIDIQIIKMDGKVFFATFFTLDNINSLMLKENIDYFWADSMVVVRDLRKESIQIAISEILNKGNEGIFFSEIGTIESIYSFKGLKTYDEVVDML